MMIQPIHRNLPTKRTDQRRRRHTNGNTLKEISLSDIPLTTQRDKETSSRHKRIKISDIASNRVILFKNPIRNTKSNSRHNFNNFKRFIKQCIILFHNKDTQFILYFQKKMQISLLIFFKKSSKHARTHAYICARARVKEDEPANVFWLLREPAKREAGDREA